MGSSAARKAWATRRRHKASAHDKRKKEFWIGPAVKRPGALRAKVLKQFGRKGFDKKGRINPSSLNQMLKSADVKTRQQIQFALNVRGLGKRYGGK
jgi:hypothetical protein